MSADRAEAEVIDVAARLVATTEAAAAIGNIAAVSQMLVEWRHTAEVHADPDLHGL
jgi:hypothetical protein